MTERSQEQQPPGAPREDMPALDAIGEFSHRDRSSSAADFAYDVLRAGIVQGHFVPGRRMREVELADWLSISRTPLRQALARLELDGLLETLPKTGLVVSSLDEQAMFELYETREALEGAAAAMAARNANSRDLDALQAELENYRSAGSDPRSLSKANRQFHETIYRAAHNRFLLKSLQALHDALALLGPTTLSAPGRPEEARVEHARICEAIANRDPAAAEREARAHIRNGYPLRKRQRAGRM